ncbi:MAG: phospholipid carrier-dependent glycosyltransferase [Candidatus Omnitrophota bacterium]
MELVILFLTMLVCASLGARAVKALGVDTDGMPEVRVIAPILGLGTLAYCVLAAGSAGLLYRGVLVSIMALFIVLCRGEFILIPREWAGEVKRFYPGPGRAWDKVFFAFILAVCVFTFIGAAAPPTGHDALSYRLAQVWRFSADHKVGYIPYTRESLWPYLMEMLLAFGMALKSDILAKLLMWVFGILGACLVFITAGKERRDGAGYVSAAVFLLTPAIFTQMTYAYVDIPMAVYSFVSLICVLRFFETDDYKWALLGGISAGFVLSIKYTGVITLLSLGAVCLIEAVTRKKSPRVLAKGAGAFLIAAVVCSAVWYARAYIIKDNPLYPFFAGHFGGHGWTSGLEGNIGSGVSLRSLFTLPWTITMFPARFGDENFGAIYLMVLPLMIKTVWSDRRLRGMLFFAVIYASLWFFIDNRVNRFLFPVVLPLAVVAGSSLALVFKAPGRVNGLIKAVVVLALLLNVGLLVYHNADKIKVSCGAESRDEYLRRVERTYEMARYIDKNLPPDATILMVNEIRAYYLNRRYIHLRNLIEEDHLSDDVLTGMDQFTDLLTARGVNYMLYRKSDSEDYPWVSDIIASQSSLKTVVFADWSGEKYKIFLYKIKNRGL